MNPQASSNARSTDAASPLIQSMQRFAFLPLRDWNDHCKEGRLADAIASVSAGRLQQALGVAAEVASTDSGIPLQRVQELLDTVELDRLLKQLGAQAQLLVGGSQLKEFAQHAGEALAPWLIPQLGSLGSELVGKTVGWGFDKHTEAALSKLGEGLGIYEQFVTGELEKIAAAPIVRDGYAGRVRRTQLFIALTVIGWTTALALASWVGLKGHDDAPSAAAQESVPAMAARAAVPAPTQPEPTEPVPSHALLKPGPARPKQVARESVPEKEAAEAPATPAVNAVPQPPTINRTDCLRSCVANCNDDPVCERTCASQKCR